MSQPWMRRRHQPLPLTAASTLVAVAAAQVGPVPPRNVCCAPSPWPLRRQAACASPRHCAGRAGCGHRAARPPGSSAAKRDGRERSSPAALDPAGEGEEPSCVLKVESRALGNTLFAEYPVFSTRQNLCLSSVLILALGKVCVCRMSCVCCRFFVLHSTKHVFAECLMECTRQTTRHSAKVGFIVMCGDPN